MSNDSICIYCSQTDPSRFRGVEHVIPQGFGRFGSEMPTLDCVCDDCNAFFGRELDQLLARETCFALVEAGLPAGDIAAAGVQAFRFERNLKSVGYGALEVYGSTVLLRSLSSPPMRAAKASVG